MPPDDRTIVEGSSPDGSSTGGTPGDGSTIIEGASADSSTIIEGTQARAEASFNLVPGGQFQGHTLLKPLQVTSGEADLWFIADAQGKEYVLKLYRYGIKPKKEITERIRSLGYEHVVTIEESGEVSGRHFEILEKIEHGDLDEYAGDKPLEEEQLKVVVEELGSAVAHLHEAGIIHRDIKPANILVRTLEPLDLVMTDFGISSISDVSLHMTSVNRTALYSAPEAINGVVAKGSDWWCVGIIFLKLLLGKHPLEGMTEQAITFQLVTKGVKVPEEISEDWKLLLKGLLTRDPDNRWAWSEVEQWLGGKRDIATQYEGDQKEEKSYRYQPYTFNREEYYLAGELAVSLGEDWEAGKKDFARGMIRTWVEAQLADQDLTRGLYDITEDEGLDGDEKLSAGLMVMATDLPVFWKGEVVSRDWLVGNPEETVKFSHSRLLHYYDLHRSEDELKLGEIAVRVKEVSEDQELQGEERDLVVTLAVNPEHPLKLGEDIIDSQEWMAANPGEAMKILKGPLSAWQERLTGKRSLIEARDGCKAWSDAVLALGVPVDENQVDELILQSEEERNARFKALWQKFEAGEYVGAKDEKLQALLDKGEVGQVEQLVLICCDEGLFLTPQEKYQLDSMEYLKGFGLEMDWELAEKLIASNNWEEINPLWQEVLTNSLPAALEENETIQSIIQSQQAQYLDVVAVVSASKMAEAKPMRSLVEKGACYVEYINSSGTLVNHQLKIKTITLQAGHLKGRNTGGAKVSLLIKRIMNGADVADSVGWSKRPSDLKNRQIEESLSSREKQGRYQSDTNPSEPAISRPSDNQSDPVPWDKLFEESFSPWVEYIQSDQNEMFANLYGQSIPADKLAGALTHLKTAPGETAIVLVDLTVMGGCGDCLLLTSWGMRYRHMNNVPQVTCVEWNQLKGVKVGKDGLFSKIMSLEATTSGKQQNIRLDVTGMGVDFSTLVESIKGITERLKAERIETLRLKNYQNFGPPDPVHATPLKEVSVLISRQGEQMGPYALSEAQQMAQDGLILETDYLWQEGMDDWKPALEMLGAVVPSSLHNMAPPVIADDPGPPVIGDDPVPPVIIGKPIRTMPKTCPVCNTTLHDPDSAFCESCGTKI